MELYQLKKPASIKGRKRVGRGDSSGHGKTSGRGQNGAGARSGTKFRPGFEGGQMPLARRVPKRGFNNIFKNEYQIVNLLQIEKLGAETVDVALLEKAGLIDDQNGLVKILATGDLTKSVKIFADAFSAPAKEKIEKAGGSAEIRALTSAKAD